MGNCSYCGATLQPYVAFCSSCGREVISSDQVTAPPPTTTGAIAPAPQTSTAMTCVGCGRPLAPGLAVCQICGRLVDTPPGLMAPAQPKIWGQATRRQVAPSPPPSQFAIGGQPAFPTAPSQSPSQTPHFTDVRPKKPEERNKLKERIIIGTIIIPGIIFIMTGIALMPTNVPTDLDNYKDGDTIRITGSVTDAGVSYDEQGDWYCILDDKITIYSDHLIGQIGEQATIKCEVKIDSSNTKYLGDGTTVLFSTKFVGSVFIGPGIIILISDILYFMGTRIRNKHELEKKVKEPSSSGRGPHPSGLALQPTSSTSMTSGFQAHGGSPSKKKAVMVAIGVLVIIAVVVVLGYVMLQGPSDNDATGTIEVRYNSMTEDEVKIYIDDKFMGIHPSNQPITFEKISTGIHRVWVHDLADRNLDNGVVTVIANAVTTLELPT